MRAHRYSYPTSYGYDHRSGYSQQYYDRDAVAVHDQHRSTHYAYERDPRQIAYYEQEREDMAKYREAAYASRRSSLPSRLSQSQSIPRSESSKLERTALNYPVATQDNGPTNSNTPSVEMLRVRRDAKLLIRNEQIQAWDDSQLRCWRKLLVHVAHIKEHGTELAALDLLVDCYPHLREKDDREKLVDLVYDYCESDITLDVSEIMGVLLSLFQGS
jgi:hypothetical protein